MIRQIGVIATVFAVIGSAIPVDAQSVQKVRKIGLRGFLGRSGRNGIL